MNLLTPKELPVPPGRELAFDPLGPQGTSEDRERVGGWEAGAAGLGGWGGTEEDRGFCLGSTRRKFSAALVSFPSQSA